MRQKQKQFVQGLFFVGAIFLLGSGFLMLPVKKILLTATFGETRGDHLHNGIDLGGRRLKVSPLASGEMIYYVDRAEHPLIQLFGNGNLVVLQHKKKLRSYYYHLQSGSLKGKQGVVSKGVSFALSGNSGRSFGAHLHVSCSDDAVFVNPLSLFRKMRDNIAPKVMAILFIVGKREITIPKEYTLTGVDRFVFAARVYDQSEGSRKIASVGIYRIAFYLDDHKIKEYSFDTIKAVDGRARLNGRIAFSDIYKKRLYLGGKYRNILGKHIFRVRVWDKNGNSATKVVTVKFR